MGKFGTILVVIFLPVIAMLSFVLRLMLARDLAKLSPEEREKELWKLR